jgi:hypothetical protein
MLLLGAWRDWVDGWVTTAPSMFDLQKFLSSLRNQPSFASLLFSAQLVLLFSRLKLATYL